MKSDKNAGRRTAAGAQAAMGMDAGKSTAKAAVAELDRQHPRGLGQTAGKAVNPTKMSDTRYVRNKGLPMAKPRGG